MSFPLILLILAVALYLGYLYLLDRKSGRARYDHTETTIAQDTRFVRHTTISRELSILRPLFWSLAPKTAEQESEYRLIKEQLRIADWNLSYYELLCDNPQHNNATIPGEKDWALTSAELALTFAAARIERFRLLPSLTPCRPARRIGSGS
jgi:hypothetical protein